MNVLLLGGKSRLLRNSLERAGHICRETENPISGEENADFIISFGYRHIIRKDIIEKYGDRIINLHISYLPWNKGADPNLWSFLEDTKKGVTIHRISEKLDGGAVLLQKETVFGDAETLRTSYDRLIEEITALFSENMGAILSGSLKGCGQQGAGSFHKAEDKMKYAELFSELGYDTPVKNLTGKAL